MSDVLIIEDDLRVCEFIQQALRRAGIQFRIALNGRQALLQAGRNWPGLVMLDLMLPGRWDGWQVWDALCDMAAGRPLNVVVLTGDNDPVIREQAIEREALGIVRKPVHPDDLANAIRQALIQNQPGG
jgi:DNA-binding response OmpR family regulator